MALISKYLQITDRLLLEYSYDTMNSPKNSVNAGVLKTLSNELMYFENPDKDDMTEKYKDSFMFDAFPNKHDDVYYYTGYVANAAIRNVANTGIVNGLRNNNLIQSLYRNLAAEQVNYDTVRIHILTGYVFSDNDGFAVSVKAKNNKNTDVILKNFIFHKGAAVIAGDNPLISYNSQPLYMNGKFYDRYIEFNVPSAYYLGNSVSGNSTNSLADILDVTRLPQVEVTYIPINNFQVSTSPYSYINGYSMYNQGQFSKSTSVEADIEYNSNSDYFNAKLSCLTDQSCLEFYSTWGNPTDDQPMTASIMNQIETGQIPLVKNSFTEDTNSDYDSFYEIYGEDARKWIIVNQLNITFLYASYSFVSNPIGENQPVYSLQRTAKYSMTEDFADSDTASSDSDYKFYYRPVIPDVNGYECVGMIVEYNARLMNRLNGSEVVRVSTLSIENPTEVFGDLSERINVDNIYKWTIFNKNVTSAVDSSSFTNGTGTSQTKYVTKFYTNQNIVVSLDGSTYDPTAANTVVLYETAHTYTFSLYTDVALSKPYSLSDATAEYLLTYTDKHGVRRNLTPTYSTNMNVETGKLEFYIDEATSKQILAGNRHYSMIASNVNGSSTIFAGIFKSYYD